MKEAYWAVPLPGVSSLKPLRLEQTVSPGTPLKITFILVGVVAGLVAASLFYAQYVNWNEYRGELSRTMSRELGLTVELAGAIDLRLFPTPKLSARDVKLFSASAAQKDLPTSDLIAGVTRIAAEVDIFSLFTGKIEIESLELDGARLAVVEDGEGNWHVKGWPKQAAASRGTTVSLDSVSISSGYLLVEDRSNRRWIIENLNANLSGTLPSGPLEFSSNFDILDEKLDLSGRFRKAANGDISFRLDMAAEGGQARFSGRYSQESNLAARLQVSGTNGGLFTSKLLTVAGRPTLFEGDSLPFEFDSEIFDEAGLLRLTAKRVLVGRSQGRLDATIATHGNQKTFRKNNEIQKNKPHVTGLLAFSFLDLDELSTTRFLVRDKVEAVSINSVSSIQPIVHPDGTAVLSVDHQLPLTGEMDITAEAINWDGHTLQQLSADINFEKDHIGVGQMQVLVPGATKAVFTGMLKVSPAVEFGGRLNIESRNLRETIKAGSIKLPENLSPGRLITADISSALKINGDGWYVSDASGMIDTVGFQGNFSGDYNQFPLLNVALSLDEINLDAFFDDGEVEGSGSGRTSEADGQSQIDDQSGVNDKPQNLNDFINSYVSRFSSRPVAFDLTVKKLVTDGLAYDDFNFDGIISQASVVVSSLALSHKEGRMSVAGKLTGKLTGKGNGDNKRWSADLTQDFENWDTGWPAFQLPEVSHVLASVGLDRIGGAITLLGDLDDLTISTTIASNEQSLELTGKLDIAAGHLGKLELTGQVVMTDIAPLIMSYGGPDSHNLPAGLGISLSRIDAGSETILNLSGEIAGGRINAEGYLSNHEAFKFSGGYTVEQANSIVSNMSLPIEFPGPDQPLAIVFDFERVGERNMINALKIENGPFNLTVNLSLEAGPSAYGQIHIANYTLLKSDNTPGRNSPPTKLPEWLNSLTGSISITGENLSAYGQRLDTKSSQLVAGDGVIRLEFGDAALLNGQVLSGAVDFLPVGEDGMSSWHIKGQAAGVDLPALFDAQGLSAVLTGNARSDFDLQTKGLTPPELVSHLAGDLSISSGGGVLRFMEIPALIQDIQDTKSGRGFLQSMSNRLRNGTSTYNEMKTRLRFDSGVALVEEFLVTASWGRLLLDGQINMVEELLAVEGNIMLANPAGAPPIPVRYHGRFSGVQSEFTSRIFERFVLAGIERKIRSSLLSDLENNAANGIESRTPGQAIIGRAFGFLKALQDRQIQEKQAREAADQEDGPTISQPEKE